MGAGARTGVFLFLIFGAFWVFFARPIAREMVLKCREIAELVRFKTHESAFVRTEMHKTGKDEKGNQETNLTKKRCRYIARGEQ